MVSFGEFKNDRNGLKRTKSLNFDAKNETFNTCSTKNLKNCASAAANNVSQDIDDFRQKLSSNFAKKMFSKNGEPETANLDAKSLGGPEDNKVAEI